MIWYASWFLRSGTGLQLRKLPDVDDQIGPDWLHLFGNCLKIPSRQLLATKKKNTLIQSSRVYCSVQGRSEFWKSPLRLKKDNGFWKSVWKSVFKVSQLRSTVSWTHLWHNGPRLLEKVKWEFLRVLKTNITMRRLLKWTTTRRRGEEC